MGHDSIQLTRSDKGGGILVDSQLWPDRNGARHQESEGKMTNVADLISKARLVLGDETTITAAGSSDFRTLCGHPGGRVAADAVVGDAVGSPLISGVAGAVSTHAARDVNAQAHGVTSRMLVAVSPETIHLLGLPATGQRRTGSFCTSPEPPPLLGEEMACPDASISRTRRLGRDRHDRIDGASRRTPQERRACSPVGR